MIDGSSDNSILNLITGYNGLGRIFGGGSGPGGGGGGGGGNFSGATGVLRLFNSVMGGQSSWLLPAALLALGAGLIATRRAPRTDRTRAALLLWGGWLIVSGLVFSLSSGIIHTYYTVALAPAIAALVAIGGRMLWARRDTARSRVAAAVAVAVSAGWSWALLDRTPSWEPWLRTLIVAAGLAAVTGLLPSTVWRPMRGRLAVGAVVLGVIASVGGPVAYAAQTIATPHTGSVPAAGPASAGGMGGFGGGGMPSDTRAQRSPRRDVPRRRHARRRDAHRGTYRQRGRRRHAGRPDDGERVVEAGAAGQRRALPVGGGDVGLPVGGIARAGHGR